MGFYKLNQLTIATCAVKCALHTPNNGLQIHGIDKGFLKVDTWRQITEDLRRHHIEFDHIIFQWLGDPSLHPQLPEHGACRQEHWYTGGYLRIDTNAIRFDRNALTHFVPSAHRVQCRYCSFLPLMPAPPRSMKRSKVVRTINVHW